MGRISVVSPGDESPAGPAELSMIKHQQLAKIHRISQTRVSQIDTPVYIYVNSDISQCY